MPQALLQATISRHIMTERQSETTQAWNTRALLDQAPVGVVRGTVGGELLYANAAIARLLEFDSPAAMLRENAIFRYKYAADRAALIDELCQTGTVQNRELTLLTHTGAERIVITNAVMEGEFLSAMLMDITDRKASELALRRFADRLQVLADASRAFAEMGAEYPTVLDRVAQTTATGLDAECMIYLISEDGVWLQLAAVYDLDPSKAALTRMVVSADPLHVDEPSFATRIFQTSQPIFFPVVDLEQMHAVSKPTYRASLDLLEICSIIGVPMCAQGRTIGVLVLFRHDLTQPPFDQDDFILAQDLADRATLAISNASLFRQAQRELAERQQAEQALAAERALLAQRVDDRTADLSLANAELSRAVRIKDEFLATMSHELRTPLSVILGCSEAIQEEIYGPITQPQAEALRGITESGMHLLTLINDILDFARIESGQLDLEYAPLDIGLLCHTSLRMVTQLALMKRISINLSFDGIVESIQGDERRLKQILVNLLANAVKFTPEGGKVGLEVCGDIAQQKVTFRVWDTGIGIAADDLPKLFQPFVQIDSSLSRQYTGTGLGLSLVLRLAKAHGGGVSVESAPGQGSCFSVTLPWEPAPPSANLAAASIAVDAPMSVIGQAEPAEETPFVAVVQGRRSRILLAEDNLASSTMLYEYLQAKGYTVTVARNGGEALARAQEESPDIILMDIQMPDIDGLEAIRLLRATPGLGTISIIAVTALVMPGDRERCLAAGADNYLAKPVDLHTLVAMIESYRRVYA